jgi:VanZ family protein
MPPPASRRPAPKHPFPVRISPQLVRRTWWAIGWLGIGAVVYLSLMPDPPALAVEQGDKLQHLAAYGTLMLWFAQLTDLRSWRRAAAIALVGLGIAMEFAQLATDYREFSYGDMVADALGVALGGLLAPPRLPNLLALTARILTPRTPR